MTIHIDMNTLFIVQLISIISILVLGVIVIKLLKLVKRLTDQLSDNNRLLYFNLKDSNQMKYNMDDTLDRIDLIETNVSQLSSDLQIKIQRDEEESKRKVYPTPELSRMIAETIREQVEIEMILSKNLTAPSGEYVDEICHRVMKTYPKIEPDYILRKCLSVIEVELAQYRSSE